jgi:ATP/maltotriose-dependent transcriptional regulator MalT
MACLNFHQAVAQRNWAAATLALQSIDRGRTRPGGDTGPIDPFEALFAAFSGEGALPELRPPPLSRLVLTNLAAGVTGAQAVALAGSRAAATEWLEWVAGVRRRGVESCLEAPVSLQRVHGLLALRAGKTALARKNLEQAARAGVAGGRCPEGAIAALQAQELKTKTGAAVHAEQHQAARKAVAELGIDPMPHMYVVHQAWDVGSAPNSRPLLTPRETEVLRELARGKSYKAAAESLGISWTTVQTLSHRVYEKLSVTNKVEAIEEGRRLGLL